ncbi:MAG TPA: lysophospholipid acyltransferase family protein [Stellaceae bacterium]|nr:lysophospholipid acyltransferase family protein [Stellaceae bacterium]
MIWLRSLLFHAAFYLWTAALALPFLPLLLAPPLWMMRCGTVWSRGTLLLLRLCTGLDYRVVGRERLPAGPVLIAMKHQSAWDTFAAPVIFRNPVMVIKRELGWIPIYGWYALKAGMIPVDRMGRASALKAMVEASARALERGRPVLIFPEGTRSAVGEHHPYQPGVAALYQRLGVPLVPVAVDSGVFWARRSLLRRPGRITVEILPAIAPGGERRAVLAELECRIEAATARLVAAAQQPAGDKVVESVTEPGTEIRG